MNITLIVCAILIFALISFEPLMNRIFTKQYLDIALIDNKTICKAFNYSTNLQILTSLFLHLNTFSLDETLELRSFTVEIMAINYNVISMIFYPTLKLVKPDYYFSYLLNLINQSDY